MLHYLRQKQADVVAECFTQQQTATGDVSDLHGCTFPHQAAQ